MSSVNSDNFLAVALVINRSRDGPAFVFHYPEQVQPTSNATEQPDPNELEDILLERLSQPADRDGIAGTDSDDLPPRYWKHDEHIMTESGSQIVPWEHVAGFPARDLASILTPARAYHKTQFQLSLDPLYCVSYPVHVPENGKWKKAKKVDKDAGSSKAGNERTAPQESESASSKPEEAPKDKDGKNAKDESDEEKRSSMTMFNLVFILQPRKHDVKGLVDTLYSNIVKKANKAYMYSQQHSDFVWKESKRILAAKEKAREERKLCCATPQPRMLAKHRRLTLNHREEDERSLERNPPQLIPSSIHARYLRGSLSEQNCRPPPRYRRRGLDPFLPDPHPILCA